MWRWVLVASAGCSFQPPENTPADASGGADATAADARVLDAAPDPDAPDPVTSCSISATSTTGADRGRVGSNGGAVQRDPLACAAPLQIVGLAMRMSNQNTENGGRSAHALVIGCAAVTVDSNGVGTTGTITTQTLTANGGFDWTPSTLTPMTSCQPGWVVSGLTAHTGPNNNLFLDVALTCAKLGPTGAIVATETVPVAGSLTEPAGTDTETCGANEVLVRIPNRIGAGIDSVNLSCSTLACT